MSTTHRNRKIKLAAASATIGLVVMFAAWIHNEVTRRIDHTFVQPIITNRKLGYSISSFWYFSDGPPTRFAYGRAWMLLFKHREPSPWGHYIQRPRTRLTEWLNHLLHRTQQRVFPVYDPDGIDVWTADAKGGWVQEGDVQIVSNVDQYIGYRSLTQGSTRLETHHSTVNRMPCTWSVLVNQYNGSISKYTIDILIHCSGRRAIYGFTAHATDADYPAIRAEMEAIRDSLRVTP